MREIDVTNYSHVEKGILVDANGEKYVIAEDDNGYMNILSGGVSVEDSDTFYAETQDYHVNIPTGKLHTAIERAQEL